MTDASLSDSVAMRARKLTALSRAKSDNEKETQDQSQVETALRKLNAELGELGTVLAAHRKLIEVGVPVQAVAGLDKPVRRLLEQVEGIGRPAAQFLTARSKDVSTTRSDISDTDKSAWRSWAEQAIAQLPTGLAPTLNPAQRQQVTTKIGELKRASAVSQVGPSDVTIFTVTLQTVKEMLAAAGESDLNGVLAKFENGRVRLAELSDDELRMIREASSLSEQLYLVFP
jgi:chorismate mutase